MIQQIKEYLLQKGITVPAEWIPACVEFMKSEVSVHGNQKINNLVWLREKVFEQWLHSDLTSLATCCLPFGLSKQTSTTIKGQYALQVNYVKDVGLPAYNQLQKLRKEENENASVSADKLHTAAWEPKPSRMLLLQLTDGTSIIQGMEYKPISCLSIGMKPGIKVLIRGRIEARRGVLLLTKEHVTLLGGEVDTLLVPNAQENVLCKALRIEETENPIAIPEGSVASTAYSSDNDSQYYPSCTAQSRQVSIQRDRMNEPSSSMLNKKNPPPNNNTCIDNDGFDDFLDEDMEMALIEAEKTASLLSSQTSHQNSFNSNIDFKKNIYNTKTSNISEPFTAGNSFKSPTTNFKPKRGCNNFKSSKTNYQQNQNFGNNNSVILPFEDDDDEELLLAAERTINNDNIKIEQSDDEELLLAAERTINYGNIKIEQNDDEELLLAAGRTINNSEIKIEQTSNNSKWKPFGQGSSSKPLATHRQSKITGFMTNLKPALNFQDRNNVSASTNNSISFEMPKIKREKIRSIVESNPAPFQYICYINFCPTEKVFYVVKGFVSTLISKLGTENGLWKLSAKINDGTGSCNVDIDDIVLRRLIGITPEEFDVKRKEARLNPQLRSTVWQYVGRCQMELISMCCLLQLEFGPHLSNPKVVKLMPLSETHLEQLKARELL